MSFALRYEWHNGRFIEGFADSRMEGRGNGLATALDHESTSAAFATAPVAAGTGTPSFRDTTPGGGCFSTALVTRGKPRLLEAQIARLLRDAKRLGLSLPAPELLARAFYEPGVKHFGVGRGIVRVDLQRDAAGATHVLAASRSLTSTPSTAEAITHSRPHPGPSAFPGAKLVTREFFTVAHEAARATNCHEALLFDAKDFLVEGSYSSIVVLRRDGALCTPPLTRGGVDGIARGLLREGVAELRECELTREDVAQARELIFVNAVRGAVPIVALDGKPIGEGRVGAWAARLQELFRTLAQEGA